MEDKRDSTTIIKKEEGDLLTTGEDNQKQLHSATKEVNEEAANGTNADYLGKKREECEVE